jgi:hypothetical protein
MEPGPKPRIAIDVRAMDSRQALRLAKAIASALKESIVNIQLATVAEVGLSQVIGVLKNKLGMFAVIPQLMYHLANQDWQAAQGLLYEQIYKLTGIDDLVEMYEAISKIDNGVAAAALMKNPDYKNAISKGD